MTAGIDVCLAIVEQDLGVETAHAIAKAMLVDHRRSSGQSQFSGLLEPEPKNRSHPEGARRREAKFEKQLLVDDLADAANLTRRQFSRAFSRRDRTDASEGGRDAASVVCARHDRTS